MQIFKVLVPQSTHCTQNHFPFCCFWLFHLKPQKKKIIQTLIKKKNFKGTQHFLKICHEKKGRLVTDDKKKRPSFTFLVVILVRLPLLQTDFIGVNEIYKKNTLDKKKGFLFHAMAEYRQYSTVRTKVQLLCYCCWNSHAQCLFFIYYIFVFILHGNENVFALIQSHDRENSAMHFLILFSMRRPNMREKERENWKRDGERKNCIHKKKPME